jgi:hypothetical protein
MRGLNSGRRFTFADLIGWRLAFANRRPCSGRRWMRCGPCEPGKLHETKLLGLFKRRLHGYGGAAESKVLIDAGGNEHQHPSGTLKSKDHAPAPCQLRAVPFSTVQATQDMKPPRLPRLMMLLGGHESSARGNTMPQSTLPLKTGGRLDFMSRGLE